MEEQVLTRKEQIEALPRGVLVYEEAGKEQEKLAKKAKRVLGYSGLLSFTAGGRLQAALEMLGIEVIEPKAIFEYQSQYGRAILSQPIQFVDKANFDDDDEASDSASDSASDEQEMRPLMKTKGRIERGGRGYSWERVPMSRYIKAIPEFVVNKAIQIKEALPQVSIFVEELHKDPDPFLVVTYRGENYTEEYYIEVWEEPKFEGRFTAAKK